MENLKIILRTPTAWLFIAAFFFAIFVQFEENKGIIEREKWITACHDLGGETHMDDYGRFVGDSLCLKPNSIIKVEVNDEWMGS